MQCLCVSGYLNKGLCVLLDGSHVTDEQVLWIQLSVFASTWQPDRKRCCSSGGLHSTVAGAQRWHECAQPGFKLLSWWTAEWRLKSLHMLTFCRSSHKEYSEASWCHRYQVQLCQSDNYVNADKICSSVEFFLPSVIRESTGWNEMNIKL